MICIMKSSLKFVWKMLSSFNCFSIFFAEADLPTAEANFECWWTWSKKGRLEAVDGTLDLHSYGKEKNFGLEVTCVEDDDWEIKKDVKVSAVQLVNYVFENVEKESQIDVNWTGS